MPSFGSALKLQKIPALGLVPEKSGTPPTSPVTGQLWTDTSVSPNLVRTWDGTGWVSLQLYAGTTAGSYTAGNDARFTSIQYTTAKDAANGYAGLDGSSKILIAEIPTAGSGVSSGTLVPLANDSRLSDNRTPTDASVTGGTAGAGVKIAANTITDANVAAANKDGIAGTASLRTLGTGATQAMAGSTTLSSIAAPTADVNLNGFKITGLAAPVSASDAARLTDVNAAQAGIDNKPSARLLLASNDTLSGLAARDGVTPVAGDRVLAVAQTTASQNGIYVAAAGAWTRATDTITPQAFWLIEEGTTYGSTQWKVSTTGTITVGTTALTINQFAAAGVTYSGTTNRVTVSGTQIDISANYVGQASIVTVGTVTTGVWNGTSIAVANGGTGAADAATARTNLGVARAGYAATLGAVVAGTPLVVTHSLGTQDVIAQVRDASTNEYIYLDVINASTTTVTVTSGVAYSANALRIVVLPVA